MSNNLNFFQGKSENLPPMENLQKNSFYLTTDSYDFYYTNSEKDLIRFATNPKETIKEIHTYYSTDLNPDIPTTFPPSNTIWSSAEPEYIEGEQIYSINCFIYMDDSFKYSEINELITFSEIDEICNNNTII